MTHFLFKNKEIHISKDLVPVFDFLKGIEEDIECSNDLYKKIDGARDSILVLLETTQYFVEKLKENDIDFVYNPRKDFQKLTEELDSIDYSLRFQFLGLFAYIETLMTLFIAYYYELKNDKDILSKSNEATFKEFWNRYFFVKKILITKKTRRFYLKQMLLRLDDSEIICFIFFPQVRVPLLFLIITQKKPE